MSLHSNNRFHSHHNEPVTEQHVLPLSVPTYGQVRLKYGVAAIAQWFLLRLPFCGPWFESQAHHLHTLFQFILFKLELYLLLE